MKENSRCEVQKENFCDGEAGQFLDAFTDGSAGYIHGGISGADVRSWIFRRLKRKNEKDEFLIL